MSDTSTTHLTCDQCGGSMNLCGVWWECPDCGDLCPDYGDMEEDDG